MMSIESDMAEVTKVCQKYHQHKVKMTWVSRFDMDTRCEIRRSLRMLKDIRDFNGTLQVWSIEGAKKGEAINY